MRLTIEAVESAVIIKDLHISKGVGLVGGGQGLRLAFYETEPRLSSGTLMSAQGSRGRGRGLVGWHQSINQSKRKTSNANGQTNLGHKHKAPDHNHEATQPMVDLPHTS